MILGSPSAVNPDVLGTPPIPEGEYAHKERGTSATKIMILMILLFMA